MLIVNNAPRVSLYFAEISKGWSANVGAEHVDGKITIFLFLQII